jgi:hypothetical protein
MFKRHIVGLLLIKDRRSMKKQHAILRYSIICGCISIRECRNCYCIGGQRSQMKCCTTEFSNTTFFCKVAKYEMNAGKRNLCLLNYFVGRNKSVCIATRYGLDGPGTKPRWGRGFPHQSRPALGLTRPPV